MKRLTAIALATAMALPAMAGTAAADLSKQDQKVLELWSDRYVEPHFVFMGPAPAGDVALNDPDVFVTAAGPDLLVVEGASASPDFYTDDIEDYEPGVIRAWWVRDAANLARVDNIDHFVTAAGSRDGVIEIEGERYIFNGVEARVDEDGDIHIPVTHRSDIRTMIINR